MLHAHPTSIFECPAFSNEVASLDVRDWCHADVTDLRLSLFLYVKLGINADIQLNIDKINMDEPNYCVDDGTYFKVPMFLDHLRT